VTVKGLNPFWANGHGGQERATPVLSIINVEDDRVRKGDFRSAPSWTRRARSAADHGRSWTPLNPSGVHDAQGVYLTCALVLGRPSPLRRVLTGPNLRPAAPAAQRRVGNRDPPGFPWRRPWRSGQVKGRLPLVAACQSENRRAVQGAGSPAARNITPAAINAPLTAP
jgi:hypothetical protein